MIVRKEIQSVIFNISTTQYSYVDNKNKQISLSIKVGDLFRFYNIYYIPYIPRTLPHKNVITKLLARFSGVVALQRHHGGDLRLGLPGPEAGLQCGGCGPEVGDGGGGGDDE